MAAVPIYVWNGTAWQETGPTIPASPIKYQASAPTSPSTGDIWVDSDADVTSGSQQFQRFRFVASGGETTISGADANGAVLAYTAGAELVVLNGSTLVRGQDYTATNGTSITGLSPALVANDVLEVFSFIAFNVANTYTQSQVDGLLADYVGLRLLTPSSVVGGTIGTSGAVTFSGASAVSLNGVFSSTYQNYRIISNTTASGSTGYLNWRLRASASDITGANYTNSASQAPFASGGALSNDGSGTGQTTWRNYGYIDSTESYAVVTDIFNPFASGYTSYTNLKARIGYGGEFAAGVYKDAASADGFTIYPSSGTITGTIRVYGYKN